MFVRISEGRLLNVLRIAVIYPKEHLQARGLLRDDADDLVEAGPRSKNAWDGYKLDKAGSHVALLECNNGGYAFEEIGREADPRWTVYLDDDDLALVIQAIEKTVGLM